MYEYVHIAYKVYLSPCISPYWSTSSHTKAPRATSVELLKEPPPSERTSARHYGLNRLENQLLGLLFKPRMP